MSCHWRPTHELPLIDTKLLLKAATKVVPSGHPAVELPLFNDEAGQQGTVLLTAGLVDLVWAGSRGGRMLIWVVLVSA